MRSHMSFSLAFMLAAEIGLFLTSEGDYFDSPKTRYNYKCHKMFTGYDVWLGNFRGTKYSRQHTRLDPDQDAEFWRFTLHELGVNDLATMINSVIEVSGKSSLYFVGHSMGTTAYLILASTRPREVDVVKRAVLLAPVVEPHNMTNIVGKLSGLHR